MKECEIHECTNEHITDEINKIIKTYGKLIANIDVIISGYFYSDSI